MDNRDVRLSESEFSRIASKVEMLHDSDSDRLLSHCRALEARISKLTVDVRGIRDSREKVAANLKAARYERDESRAELERVRAERDEAQERIPMCHLCGQSATCIGEYETSGEYIGAACDDCCGHCGEDGECTPAGEWSFCKLDGHDLAAATARAEKAEAELAEQRENPMICVSPDATDRCGTCEPCQTARRIEKAEADLARLVSFMRDELLPVLDYWAPKSAEETRAIIRELGEDGEVG